MKKLLLSICAILAFTLLSCGSEGNGNSNSESDYSYEYVTSPYATPEYFTESEQVTNYCGECGGSGIINTYNGPMRCYICNGAGVNISFKSRQAYYAECVHHKGCKLFQAERTGSSKCKCGCLTSSHVKRYM